MLHVDALWLGQCLYCPVMQLTSTDTWPIVHGQTQLEQHDSCTILWQTSNKLMYSYKGCIYAALVELMHYLIAEGCMWLCTSASLMHSCITTYIHPLGFALVLCGYCTHALYYYLGHIHIQPCTNYYNMIVRNLDP